LEALQQAPTQQHQSNEGHASS